MTQQDNRTLTYTLKGKTEGQQNIDSLRSSLLGVQGILKQLKKEAEGTTLLSGAGKAAREQAQVVTAQAQAAIASSKAQAAEARRVKAEQDALTASLRAQGAQARVTAQLAAAASRDQQKAIDDVIRSLDNQQKSTRNLRQANQSYTVDMIEDQRRIQAEALKTAQLFDKTSNEYRRLTGIAASAQRTMDAGLGKTTFGGFSHGVVTGIQNSGLFDQIAAMGGPAGQSLGIIFNGFQNVKKSALEATGATNGAATAAGLMGAAGATAAVGVGALAYATVNASRVAMQFEQNMADAKVSVGANAEEFKALEGAALNMGKGLGFGAREAAQGLEALGSQGVTAQQALDGALQSSMVLARATTGNLTQAATVNAGVLNAFKMQAKDLPDVADTISAAVNNTTISMDNLGQGIAAGGAMVKSFGVEFRDYLAMLSIGTDAMLQASDAGTSLKSMFMAFTPNSKEAKLAMKELGFSAFDAEGNFIGMEAVVRKLTDATKNLTPEQRAMKLETIFGSDAVRMINLLIDKGADGLRERIDLLNKTGEAQRSATEKMKTAQGATLEWQRATEKLQIAWASGILPVFTKFLNEVATPMLDTIGDFVQKLNEVKSPGDLKATLKITSEDDFTTATLKFLTGGVVQVKNTAAGITEGLNNTSFMQNIRKLDAFGLQTELQRMGVIETPKVGDFKGLAAQFDMIVKDMEGWRKRLASAYAAEEQERQKAVAAFNAPKTILPPAPLVGQGPLLPGQTRDLGAGVGSADTIQRMNPQFRQTVLSLMGEYIGRNAGGLVPYIHEGYRSVERQNQLYAQGRATPGSIVTNAKGGQSIHNYGVAADIYWRDPVTGKVVSFDDPRALEAARALGKLATAKGMIWGGTPGWGGPVDMPHIQENISWQQAQKKYGLAAPPPTPTVNTPAGPKSDQALITEAKRILSKIEEYEKAGKVTPMIKAQGVLKSFEESSTRTAGAVQVARKQLADLNRETSKYGQTYDRLDARMTEAEGWFKLNQDGQKYVKTLQNVSAEALKASRAESDPDRKAALFKLSADSADKARQVQEQARRQQETTQREADQREKQRLQAQTNLRQAVLKRDADGAARHLASLKSMQADELSGATLTAQQKKAIVERTGPAILKAEYAVNALLKKQRDDATRVWSQGEEAKLLTTQQVAEEVRRRNAESRAIEKADNLKAQGDLKRAREQAGQEVKAEDKKAHDERVQRQREVNRRLAEAAEAARQADISGAELALKGLQEQRDRDLRGAKDNLVKRLELTRYYAEKERDAMKAVADARYADTTRDLQNKYAGKPNDPTFLKLMGQAGTTRDQSYAAADALVDERTGPVLDSMAEKVRALREQYRALADSIRQKTEAHTFDEKAQKDAATQMGTLARAVNDAGLAGNTFILGAQKSVTGLIDLGKAAQTAHDQVVEFNQAVDDSAKAQSDLADDWLARAQDALDNGDFLMAFALLSEGIDAVTESAGNLPVSTVAVGKLSDKLLELNDRFSKPNQQDMQDWVRTFKEVQDTVHQAFDDWEKNNTEAKTQQGQDDQVNSWRDRGARALLDQLLPQGEYQRFGDQFAFDFTEQTQKSFLAAINGMSDEEIASVGTRKLEAILEGIANDPNPELFEPIRARIEGGLKVATLRGISDDLTGDLNQVLDGVTALKAELGDSQDPVLLTKYQEGMRELATRAEAIAEAGRDLDVGSWAATVAQGIRADAEGVTQTLDMVFESLNSGVDEGQAALIEYVNGILSAIDAASNGFKAGTLGPVEYNEVLTENETKLQQLHDRLVQLGPDFKDAAAGAQVLLDGIRENKVDVEQLTTALRNLNLAGIKKGFSDRNLQYQSGTLSADELGRAAAGDVQSLSKMATNLERLGKAGAAQEVRALIAELIKGMPVAAQAALKFQMLAGARDAMNDARRGAVNLVQGSPAEFAQGWEKLKTSLEGVKEEFPEMGKEIDKLIGKQKLFASLNKVNSYLDLAQKWGQAFQKIASVVGEDEIAQGIGQLVEGFQSAGQAVGDWARVAAGDMTALPGAIMNTVSAVDSLLNGIQALDPAYRQWHKNQMEIIKLQREGAGQAKYNDWLANPYYDQLTQDAANRDKAASAGPLKRFWWSITNTAPQVMEDGKAKTLAAAGKAFNDLATDLASSFETEMMNAVESGDWDAAGANIDRMIDRFINRTVIQVVLAKSKLGDLIKQYADEIAAGGDGKATLNLIRDEKDRVIDTLKTNADLIAVAGDSIFKGLGDDLSSSMEDALLQAWESGDWTAAEDAAEKKLNRFVASMALKALMATSKIRELVDAYVAEYEAGGDTTDELAAINTEMGRLNTAWQGMAPTLPGYGQNPASNKTVSASDTRQRNEVLYQYENATDPKEREKYRQELLGLDGKTSGSGPQIAVITQQAAGPDFDKLRATIEKYSDRLTLFEQAGQIQLEAARKQDAAADKQLQAAGMILLAAQTSRAGGSASGPGFNNF